MTVEEVNSIIAQIKESQNRKVADTEGVLPVFSPNSKRFYRGNYKRWKEVIDSLKEKPEFARVIEKKCPFCKHQLIALWYCSSVWSWRNWMGDAGCLKICPNCGKQIAYTEILMN